MMWSSKIYLNGMNLTDLVTMLIRLVWQLMVIQRYLNGVNLRVILGTTLGGV